MSTVSNAVAAYRKSTMTPAVGELCVMPGQNEMRVFDGSVWITCNQPYNEACEHYFREKFEGESEHIHEQHPDLKVLWEEYRILRRLKTGE